MNKKEQEIKNNILESDDITGKDESKLLEEVDHIFSAYRRAHISEVNDYKEIISKLNKALELANKRPEEKNLIRNIIKEMRNDIYEFEVAHPKLTNSVQNIITVFNNLGFV